MESNWTNDYHHNTKFWVAHHLLKAATTRFPSKVNKVEEIRKKFGWKWKKRRRRGRRRRRSDGCGRHVVDLAYCHWWASRRAMPSDVYLKTTLWSKLTANAPIIFNWIFNRQFKGYFIHSFISLKVQLTKTGLFYTIHRWPISYSF